MGKSRKCVNHVTFLQNRTTIFSKIGCTFVAQELPILLYNLYPMRLFQRSFLYFIALLAMLIVILCWINTQ